MARRSQFCTDKINTMKTLKAGDKIPLSPKLVEMLKAAGTKMRDADLAFRKASRWMREEEDNFWKIVGQEQPDLLDIAEVIYNHETQELVVFRMKPPEFGKKELKK